MGATTSQRIRSLPFRQIALNTLLTLVSLVLGYLAIEFLFFRVVLPNANLGVRPHVPETAGILMQNSKAGYVPKNYIAILGDSYAQGLGDWLLSNGNNEALPFSPAHVLHAITGRDVVSFGRGGSGSAEAYVREPARILGGGECAIFPRIPPPSQLLAFFYEGNDPIDNVLFYTGLDYFYGPIDDAFVKKYIAEDYGRFPWWKCHLFLGDMTSRMAKFYFEYSKFKPSDLKPSAAGGNEAIVGGRVVALPAPLEAPPVELSEGRIRMAMDVFDMSMTWLRARFPGIPITVVYIPSPLAIYRKTDEIATTNRAIPRPAPLKVEPAKINALSLRLCRLVGEGAARHDAGFLDTRPALRAAAETELIHGPVDWHHLNEKGYRVLAAQLAMAVRDPARHDTCND